MSRSKSITDRELEHYMYSDDEYLGDVGEINRDDDYTRDKMKKHFTLCDDTPNLMICTETSTR